MRRFLTKGLALTLAAVMSISLTACGNGNTTADNGDDEVSGYVYVPEFITIKEEEGNYMYSPSLQGDRLYYTAHSYNTETMESTSRIAYRELSNINTEKFMEIPDFQTEAEGYSSDMSTFTLDREGNVYAVWNVYPVYVEGEEYNYNDQSMYLCKYDNSMNQVYVQDLKEALTDVQNSYIQYLVTDSEGNVYGSSNNMVYMFDKEGSFKKTITLGTDWIENLFTTVDGKIFAAYYGMNGREIVELDTAAGTTKASYGNFPDMNGISKGGSEGKLLISGSSKLYEYDLATGESTVLLDWLQCNIDGNNVQDFAILEDGRIAAYCDNYSGSPELAILTKTESSQVTQKEIITLATLYEGDSNLQSAIVNFNKTSAQYQIQIKSYIDNSAEWTEDTYTDALSRLQADIVSKDSPDIFDLSSVNWENLTAKGALEDLTPYMEKSTLARPEDFEPSVLAAYNIDGKQLTVPACFMITTMMAKKSVVGEEPGWTLQDVMDLAKEYPDSYLMRYGDKLSALELCLQYSSESFIDYETGTCSFDSPAFIEVLEFANSFPETSGEYDTSFPTMVQTGKVLLSNVHLSDVQQYQMYHLMYEGDGICIGYPTADGSAGIFLQGYEMYGISAQSAHKDGAWAFIESLLAADDSENHLWQFPSRKDELSAVFEEAMKIQYKYDDNGEILKDEEGNPVQEPKTIWGYEDWQAEIYAATQEEIDAIKDMIAMAKLPAGNDQTVFSMIYEDAEPFFKGQKSAAEVAKIIQSRVEIYISENN